MRSIWTDLATLHSKQRRGAPCYEDDLLDMEARFMAGAQNPLVLNPSPVVAKLDNVVNYNRSKSVFLHKRTRISDQRQEEAASVAENHRLMLMKDPRRREFRATDEWRKRKALADAEPMLGVDTKRHTKQKRSPLSYNNMGKISRTVRFLASSKHTILNVYERTSQGNIEPTYEAVLRWGLQKDTAIGGVSMRFSLGGPGLLDHLVGMFIETYKITDGDPIYDSNNVLGPDGKVTQGSDGKLMPSLSQGQRFAPGVTSSTLVDTSQQSSRIPSSSQLGVHHRTGTLHSIYNNFSYLEVIACRHIDFAHKLYRVKFPAFLTSSPTSSLATVSPVSLNW
ncbi:hypothetical protein HDU93_003826 [Gonapodya sp. JEL0774]|nr:hypothetical protein HDU93_003826 [Gonapodya sp. JEL0774]